MGRTKLMNSVAERYKADVDFLLVYICEAHASDEWPVAGNLNIKSHSSIQDRALAAKALTDYGIPYPVVLDNMDNVAAVKYAANPERLYVILDGIVVYQGTHGPAGYQPAEVDTFLKQLVSKTS
ncbi:type I iodothyronine deiodinase-like [Gigantopelta aegis]|uniref:type I iodothyronine deiodinase-like n=1 Tax=Gigantopelta aegis TaxID=1735272 RepID=UPI001B88C1B2|nr:type I iodothyronine deiodinase-like [Gigantopelta aegis]